MLPTDTSASYAAYLGRIGFGTARQHCMGSPMSSVFDREQDQQEVCRKSRSTAAVPVSMPVPVDRECEEVRRDEASGGEGCDTMPSGVPVGVTSRAPRRWPTFTSPTVFENWPVPTPTDSTSWTGSWTDRPHWTVLTGRELAAETVLSGSSYRLPAALRPAHGLRTDTFGVLSCVAQLGARGCTDRSLGRSRECYWHAGATVLRTGRSVAVDRLTFPRASTAVMRWRQTQPGTGQVTRRLARGTRSRVMSGGFSAQVCLRNPRAWASWN